MAEAAAGERETDRAGAAVCLPERQGDDERAAQVLKRALHEYASGTFHHVHNGRFSPRSIRNNRNLKRTWDTERAA